jgi:hypothetical protein
MHSVRTSLVVALVAARLVTLVLAAAAAVLGCVGVAASSPLPGAGRATVTEYRGGRWFDGRSFARRTMWVAGERFETARPDRVDAVVDLHDGFVVPPYAEGHNHWLEPTLVATYIDAYLRDGIFYMQDLSTPPRFHDAIRPRINLPTSVDYIAAHQGFTGPAGHPIEIIDQLVALGVLPAAWGRTHGEGDALFVVASEDDVARAWPRLVAGHPDFVKLFLIHSDEYPERRDNPALAPKQRGIDPALVPGIVARAHADHLRVTAHIENAHDFHVAVAAGVDDFAHLPFVAASGLEHYRLADDDVRAAGARKATIATTLDWASDAAGPDDPRLAVVRDNLVRLRRAGVTVLIGTDLFRTTARTEVDLLARLQVMTNLELLRAWSIDTPRAIFPHRDIGRLERGAEASFLVLSGDPLADFAHAHDITLWVKQGHRLEPPATAFPPLQPPG